MSILNPVNGAVVEDDLDTLTRAEIIVDKWLRSLWLHYRFRDELRARIAELCNAGDLPRPRHRTDAQAKVAACPRCMGRLG